MLYVTQNNTGRTGKFILVILFIMLLLASCNIYENKTTKKLPLIREGMTEKQVFDILGKPFTVNFHCDTIQNNCTKIYYYQAPFIYAEGLRVIFIREENEENYMYKFYDLQG